MPRWVKVFLKYTKVKFGEVYGNIFIVPKLNKKYPKTIFKFIAEDAWSLRLLYDNYELRETGLDYIFDLLSETLFFKLNYMNLSVVYDYSDELKRGVKA